MFGKTKHSYISTKPSHLAADMWHKLSHIMQHIHNIRLRCMHHRNTPKYKHRQ